MQEFDTVLSWTHQTQSLLHSLSVYLEGVSPPRIACSNTCRLSKLLPSGRLSDIRKPERYRKPRVGYGRSKRSTESLLLSAPSARASEAVRSAMLMVASISRPYQSFLDEHKAGEAALA